MRVFAVVVSALLLSMSAAAQGLSDVRQTTVLPNSQAGAVDDAMSLLVNPAGLGAVRGFEMQAGWFGRNDGLTFDHRGDGVLALNTFFGTIAGGFGVVSPYNAPALLRSSLGIGLQLDPAVLIGAAVHSVGQAGGLGVVSFDVGTQLRLMRGLSLGIVGERLGASGGSVRAGLSVRPLHELLTIGIDARFKPANLPDFGQAVRAGAVVPALTARLHLGGVTFGLGAEVLNLGGVGAVDIAALGLVQVDFGNVGIAGQGGAFGLGTDTVESGGGVRGRISTVPWDSVLTPTNRWLAL